MDISFGNEYKQAKEIVEESALDQTHYARKEILENGGVIWQKKYAELNDEQQKAIRDIYPQKISEAEPKKYGDKK